MKWLFAALALVAAGSVPGVASAHPLGNFTVNHYSRIEPSADRVRVVYVLDMAEIPTFQEKPRFAANPETYADQRAEEIGRNLRLWLNGEPAALRLDLRSIAFPEGAGGLSTLRLEATYSAELAGASAEGATVDLAFRDDNDPTRIGWREIIARPGVAGAQIQHSSVPAQDVTDALRQYPEDLLSSPLNVREAHLGFTSVSGVTSAGPAAVLLPGSATAPAATDGATSSRSLLQPGAAARGDQPASVPGAAVAPFLPPTGVALFDRARSALAELANGAELTPTFTLFAVGVALVLGAAHALQPGHGKTIVAAYLVGSHGTPGHALFLGATVTATHTAGVYALGIVTLFLSQYILPERLYPILEVVSGVLVIGIGVWLFGQRLLVAAGLRSGHGHHHHHSHDHHAESLEGNPSEMISSAFGRERAQRAGVPHGHSHAHAPGERVSCKSLLALGVSGGLLPCPEALMVLLITIAAHRVLFGLLLIVSFSTGLAAVLVAFGLLLVYARGLFARVNLPGGLASRLLPIASALVIVLAGGVITAQAVPRVLEVL